MSKLTLLALTMGTALVATGADAQHRQGGGGGMTVRHSGGGNVSVRHGGGNVVVRHGGGFRGGFRGGNFQRRLNRGFVINPFWFGPQFHINNWQAYGFADPGPDHRWVRYYDDAYLIDRGGRVADTHYGLDWDRYGERWEEEDGIPSYYGSRDYHPGDEDYAWVERNGGEREEHARGGHDGHGAPHMMQGGYGGYYGYGYGWAYPIIIETTTTTGGYVEEIVEETVQLRRAHRPRRPCNCRRAAPPRRPPPAGERG